MPVRLAHVDVDLDANLNVNATLGAGDDAPLMTIVRLVEHAAGRFGSPPG
jgi:hypothetical protein